MISSMMMSAVMQVVTVLVVIVIAVLATEVYRINEVMRISKGREEERIKEENRLIAMIHTYGFFVMDEPSKVKKGWEPKNLPDNSEETPPGVMFARIVGGPFDEFFVIQLAFNSNFTTDLTYQQQGEHLKAYLSFISATPGYPYKRWERAGIRMKGRGYFWVTLNG